MSSAASSPRAITKEQAIEAARARGDSTFADLLSGMNVVPGHGVDFAAVGRTLLLALGLYLLASLMIWVQARLLNVTIQRTMVALRADVEDKVHRLPLAYFDSRQRGEVLSRVTNDVDNIQTSLSMTISQLLTSVLTVAAVLVMMLSISPLLTLITVVTVPLSLWATRTIARRSREQFVAQWRNTGRLNAHIEETYSGFTVVKTFGHRALAEDQFRELNDDVYGASFGAQFLSGLVVAGDDVRRQPELCRRRGRGWSAGRDRSDHARPHPGLHPVRPPVQPAADAGGRNVQHASVGNRERRAGFRPSRRRRADPPDPPAAAVERRGPGRVEFEHVNFEYRPGTPVIEDLSLVAEPGSTVAIVGPTGAGKTTLVNLLMRFYEVDSGRILIDGVDITSMSRHALRSRIGMVLQDTWLFGGTIFDNIAYGRPDAERGRGDRGRARPPTSTGSCTPFPTATRRSSPMTVATSARARSS